MINAYFRVKQEISNVRLILIGDGAKMKDLKELVGTLGIQDDVIFTGFIDDPQKYINLFEIFLLSSFSEGTSMTVLEAMSLGKPCVVTDVGGNPEIVINNKTGMVVPSNDADQFSEKIIELLTDNDTRCVFGEAGREIYLKKYMVSRMVDSYQTLYLGE